MATCLRKIDYKTLLFFIGLFVVVGGLEQTGVLVMLAAFHRKDQRRKCHADGCDHCWVFQQ